jgi:hypothetical protein
MAKDPAINWYFDNWTGGTFGMSRFHKGCYMDLLTAQFQGGHLSLEEIKTVLGNDFAVWGSLSKKFAVDKTGKYFNERLEHEILKRKNFSEKQYLNGVKGGRPKTQTKPKQNPNTNPNKSLYETETENGIETVSFVKLFFPLSQLETNNTTEFIERTLQKQINSTALNDLFAAFKIQYSTDYYPNRNKVIQHFRNWLKQQKNGNEDFASGAKATAGTSEKRIAALKNWGSK